jgi:hypothetical protein
MPGLADIVEAGEIDGPRVEGVLHAAIDELVASGASRSSVQIFSPTRPSKIVLMSASRSCPSWDGRIDATTSATAATAPLRPVPARQIGHREQRLPLVGVAIGQALGMAG